jgi:NAD(P)H-dependent flavin oxidoreductase YrpB (nitropropane dioxygenase family)
MQWVGYAEMASAVSNAGGLGLVRLATSIYFVKSGES